MITHIEKNRQTLRDSFLEAMSCTAATVSIVTTDGPAGRAGVTISAMTSVSADSPSPTLLVCINQLSAACAPILENGVFCLNVLRNDQAYISDIFAGRVKTEDGDKFSSTNWVAQPTGAPRLVDPLVAFDCHITHSEVVGTHQVMFGEVKRLFFGNVGTPLVYLNRSYGTTKNIGLAA